MGADSDFEGDKFSNCCLPAELNRNRHAVTEQGEKTIQRKFENRYGLMTIRSNHIR